MYFIDLFAHLVHFLVGSLIITDSSGSPLVRLDAQFWTEYFDTQDAQCNGIVIGKVTNDELKELSGLAESHRFPDVFYSIQDSGNNPSVYVINSNGSLRGEIMLEQIRNNDFEDIAVTSRNGSHYIYVGDIGNNWNNHCMGTNQSHRMIHIFKEPTLEDYQRNRGKISMPLSNVTTLVLVDDKLDCRESVKEDSEALFIDPQTNFGYIIQKVRERNSKKNPVIFKFDARIQNPQFASEIETGSGEDTILGFETKLKRVGNIPTFSTSNRVEEDNLPNFVTGGDITTDGTKIYLRNSKRVGVWKRDVSRGQSVEEAFMENVPEEIPLCYQPGNGESIAVKHDGTGFVTVSEAEDEIDANETNVPMFFYPMPIILSN